MGDSSSFRIVPVDEIPLADIIGFLNEGLGSEHNQSWFKWKHVDNPAGRSLGWVALDEEGLIGIRMLMRWNLQFGEEKISAVRPVDTLTLPRARNQGVFRELTLFALKSIAKNDQIGIIFNTPNKNSRHGYATMGWKILPAIRHAYVPVFPKRNAGIREPADGFAAWAHHVSEKGKLMTIRTPQTLAWRYDQRSGMKYEIAQLQQANRPNGIVFRVIQRKGIRVLILMELLGLPEERKVLAHSVARSRSASIILLANGKGSYKLLSGPALPRGGSILAVHTMERASEQYTNLDSWALTLGDLERII